MGSGRRAVIGCVESLERRTLLSAAVPVLTGDPFEGTAGVSPATADLEIVVTKETKNGKLTGTYTETSSGNVNIRNFTGSVNSKLKLVLHIKKQVQVHFVIHPETVIGTVSADGNSMAGTTISGGFKGVFAVSRGG